VQTCLASATPGDSSSVLGDVTVGIPTERASGIGTPEFTLASLSHTEESTTVTTERTGSTTVGVFWVVADDETLSVGDTAEVQIRVREGNSTGTETTRTATVSNDSRSYDCD
jgi:hypothetical protein